MDSSKKSTSKWWLNPGWFALPISILTAFYTCRSSNQVGDELRSFQHRPILTVHGVPMLDSVSFAMRPGPIATTPDSGLLMDCRLRVATRMVLVNTSAVEARLVMTTCNDTMSGGARLRSALLNQKERDHLFDIRPAGDFYDASHIMPGDSVTLSFSREIAFGQDTLLTMHYLILYANPLGDVYDTYFWTRYRTGRVPLIPGPMRSAKTSDGRAIQVVPIMVSRRDVMAHLLEVIDTHEDHFIYNRAEGKAVMQWMRRGISRKREVAASPS